MTTSIQEIYENPEYDNLIDPIVLDIKRMYELVLSDIFEQIDRVHNEHDTDRKLNKLTHLREMILSDTENLDNMMYNVEVDTLSQESVEYYDFLSIQMERTYNFLIRLYRNLVRQIRNSPHRSIPTS